ncbi:MAG: hypothetical protein HY688_05015 [Chloroflexi bacterium]|nr:hypothetical protein [Chloroflexota bacterium]
MRAQALQGAFQGGVHAFVRLHALSACDFNGHIAVHQAKTLRANRMAVGRLLALGLRPWRDFITFGEGPMPRGAFEWSARLGQPVVLGFFVEWLMACVSANDIETVTIYYTTDLHCANATVLGTIEDTTSAYISG